MCDATSPQSDDLGLNSVPGQYAHVSDLSRRVVTLTSVAKHVQAIQGVADGNLWMVNSPRGRDVSQIETVKLLVRL